MIARRLISMGALLALIACGSMAPRGGPVDGSRLADGAFTGSAARIDKATVIVTIEGGRIARVTLQSWDASPIGDRARGPVIERIIDKQFATARLADIMINLFVLGCVLSRVSSSVEKHGPAAVERELQIAHALANRVRRQVRFSLHEVDDNADEEIKGLADHAFDLERFQWDTI